MNKKAEVLNVSLIVNVSPGLAKADIALRHVLFLLVKTILITVSCLSIATPFFAYKP
jgi:hypothetical protein